MSRIAAITSANCRIREQNFRRPFLKDFRCALQTGEDDSLDDVGRHLIARSYINLQPERPRRLAVIDDRVLGQRAVRHDDEVPCLGPHLRRAPRNLADDPVLAADGHPVTDAKRLFDLNREAREEVSKRILQRKTDNDSADCRRCEDPIAQDQCRDQREQRDDECVLDDVWKAVGNAIDPQGLCERDDEIDDGECPPAVDACSAGDVSGGVDSTAMAER